MAIFLTLCLLALSYICCSASGIGVEINAEIDHCYNITDDLFRVVNSTRSLLSLISVLMSIPVIALRIVQCYKRGDLIKHTDRLMIYACTATTLYAVVESIQFVRIFNLEAACNVVGMFVEYTSVSIIVVTACIGCHLIVLTCQTGCMKRAPNKTDEYKRHEVVYVALTVLLPLCLIPWPYIFTPGYGHSGAFCWISLVDDDCKPVWTSVVQIIALYYLWMGIAGPFSLVVIVMVIATLCLRKSQKVRCSTYAVLIYMMVFFMCFLVNIIGGVLLWNDSSRVWYLMIQAISEPFFTIFTTAILLVQLCWSKFHRQSHKKFAFDQNNANRYEDSQLIVQ